MVDVEEGTLRAFEKNIVAATQGFVQENDGVGNERFQIVAGGAVLGMNVFERKGLRPERFEDFVVLDDLGSEQLLEALRIDQVNDAEPGARGLIAVGRPDPAFSGADLVFALEDFALGIELAVIGQDQVRGFAEKQVPINLDAELPESFDFTDQAYRVHHDAVADHTNLSFAQNSRGHQVQYVLLTLDVDRVAGVISPLRADDYISLFGKNINNLAFAFIAPLGPHENGIRHIFKKNPRIKIRGQSSAVALRS